MFWAFCSGECHKTSLMIRQHWHGNGLVPNDTKPIPEPMLTLICIVIWCHYATMSWIKEILACSPDFSHLWIPLTKNNWNGGLISSLLLAWISCWTKSHISGCWWFHIPWCSFEVTILLILFLSPSNRVIWEISLLPVMFIHVSIHSFINWTVGFDWPRISKNWQITQWTDFKLSRYIH